MTFQIGSSLLDACVLSILLKEDTYGYKITQEIKEEFGVSESTLYPVLRRLEKDGFLMIYDEAVMGRNRRYYHITNEGKDKQKFYAESWDTFSSKITQMLRGDEQND